jgi:hypothetical protein
VVLSQRERLISASRKAKRRPFASSFIWYILAARTLIEGTPPGVPGARGFSVFGYLVNGAKLL